MLLNTFSLSVILLMTALGCYISYHLLDFPDLGADGSFAFGAASLAFGLGHNMPLPLALLFSVIAGAFAGGITGFLSQYLSISGLMAGILTSIGLYSINLRLMSRPNMPLIGLTKFSGANSTALIIAIAIVITFCLHLGLLSKLGMLFKTVGRSEAFTIQLGYSPKTLRLAGLMTANALTALSGALMALYQGFSDVNMGLGMMVSGTAALMIGTSLFGKISKTFPLLSVFLGCFLYRFAIRTAFSLGMPPSDMKLLTALILVFILGFRPHTFSFRRKQNAPLPFAHKEF